MRSPLALFTALALTGIAPAASAQTRPPPWPATLPYNEGAPIPSGYRPVSRYRTGLIIGGAIGFSAIYITTAAARGGDDKALLVPIVGPFIAAGHLDGGGSSVLSALMILDGVGQATCATLFIVGLAYKKTVLVRDDLDAVRVTPMILGHGGVGIGIVGAM